jgi:NAD(P)-dependent dehydrogenase (short-subunit alcohol dehydrogenase family)
MKLKNRVAVITGGAGGIGFETAGLFLKEGAEGVVLVDLDEQALQKASDELKSRAVRIVVADVSKSKDVKAYIDLTIKEFGRIDILFLNAGIEGVVKPITEYPEEIFDKVMTVNVKGAWLGLKHAFPHLKKSGGGSVIITSSVAGLKGAANVSAYCTSKHAITGMMRTAALEGAEHNIRVNSIHPSPVDNRMMRSLEEQFSPGHGDDVKKGFEQMIPLKRYATNDEIADLALFLASDESRFITGTTIPVDGGMTA